MAPKRKEKGKQLADKWYGSERETGNNTPPGGDKLWLHSHITETDPLGAWYLGFKYIYHMKRAVHTARASHVSRILMIFLDKTTSAPQLSEVYQQWKRHKSDNDFREYYRVDESEILVDA
ncbi:hypothetical protein PG993_006853 [Apiospora rasikravindrae]|uniref:Uncharacterized protein n=1 Tax=Apiospora rasikravindrae TaxID=990691 RepID=A0ABR1SVU9_9PEZI